MAIVWTKNWSGADDGTILRGIDLGNIQGDLAGVVQTSDVGVTVQGYNATLAELTVPQDINPANLVKNGAFDTFTAPPTPNFWVVESGGVQAQDTTNVRIGANSYAITSDASGSASRQTVLASITATTNSYYRGKEVTLTAQVYASNVSNARIRIDDGSGVSNSIYHTGTPGFEELSITHTISLTATKLDVVLLVDGNVLTAKFDAVRLNLGPLKWQFVHHRSDP